MTEELLKILKETPGINDWRVNTSETKTHEAFFVKRKLETLRATETESAAVTVFVDHEERRGDSSFSVTPAMTEEEIKLDDDAKAAAAAAEANEPEEQEEEV